LVSLGVLRLGVVGCSKSRSVVLLVFF
jgi:hypothetical protein